MTFKFFVRHVQEDDKGNVLDSIEFASVPTESVDGFQCPVCKRTERAPLFRKGGIFSCMCDEPGTVAPVEMQLVDCDWCDEYIPASEYLRHLGPCQEEHF